jgi:hypothetical protein
MNQIGAIIGSHSNEWQKLVLDDLRSGKDRKHPGAIAIGKILDEAWDYMNASGVKVLQPV